MTPSPPSTSSAPAPGPAPSAPTPPTAYPSPGTLLPSLSALSSLVHAVRPPSLDGTGAFDLLERRRGGQVSYKCKLGTRKPGRRRKGERRKEVDELCRSVARILPRELPSNMFDNVSSLPSSSPFAFTTAPSSSTAYIVTSLAPHIVAAHEAGWTGHEDNADGRSSAGSLDDRTRDGGGRYCSAEPGGPVPDGGKEASPPPNTILTRGGTLIPLLPLVPLPKLRPKPVRPRSSKEHSVDGAWEAWRALMGIEGGREERREERKRVERMGGYGALRAWGWCEGLLEPVSEEEVEVEEVEAAERGERVEDNALRAAFEQDERDAAAEPVTFYDAVPAIAPPPLPSIGSSPTQTRARPAARGRKRSKTFVDPEWLPSGARSQRSATRPLASLEDDDGQSDATGEEDDEGQLDAIRESTFPSSADFLPSIQPAVHISFAQHQPFPLRTTGSAMAPFSPVWPHPHTGASPAPPAALSPTASRDTSFEQDGDTPNTSFSSNETPLAHARLEPARQQLHAPPSSSPLVVRLSLPQQHEHPHSHRCSAEPRLPAVGEEAAGIPPPQERVAVEQRLEQEAVWALLGMKRAASAPPPPSSPVQRGPAGHAEWTVQPLGPHRTGLLTRPGPLSHPAMQRPLPASRSWTDPAPEHGVPFPAPPSPSTTRKRRRVTFSSPPSAASPAAPAPTNIGTGGGGCARPKKVRKVVVPPGARPPALAPASRSGSAQDLLPIRPCPVHPPVPSHPSFSAPLSCAPPFAPAYAATPQYPVAPSTSAPLSPQVGREGEESVAAQLARAWVTEQRAQQGSGAGEEGRCDGARAEDGEREMEWEEGTSAGEARVG
ncbi:hypothetical protein JCM10450v2_001183 [Rhodotorula kratochvilovae]